MIEGSKLNAQVGDARLETISVLEGVMNKANQFNLPKPPDAIDYYRKKLVENTYKALVVGEAKRGKSTFINALIGQDILPTNLRVATSQAFEVRPAEREAYRLRFEDDSILEITLEDLPHYGSQVLANAGEKPRLDQIIRWIEVDTPAIQFLPDGVSLLDTPGLGTLYAAHAQITHRFVPQADAVIFVLDSEKPIVQTETEFLETILDVTPNIFFIQTKIDQFSEDQWRDIQNRNQEILNETFKDRLTDIRVWPISSTLLLDAAGGGEEADEDLEDSRQKEVEIALQSFLFRAAGWSRSAEAIMVADRYRTTTRSILSQRLTALVEGTQKRNEMQRRAAEVRQQFERQWGERGECRRELLMKIKDVTSGNKKSFMQVLQRGGAVEKAQRQKIDRLESMQKAQELAETIAGEIGATAAKRWREIGLDGHAQCVKLLIPFYQAAEFMVSPHSEDFSDPSVDSRVTLSTERLLWRKFKGGRFEAMQAAGIVGVIGTVATIVTGGAAAPLAILGTAIAGLWGLVTGIGGVAARELEAAKNKLRTHVSEVLLEIQQFFGNVDPSTGRYKSLIDEYFTTLEQTMADQVRMVAKQKAEEAKAELSHLGEAEKVDDKKRQERIGQVRQQLAEWDTIGKAIERLSTRLDALVQSAAVSSPILGLTKVEEARL